MTNILENFWQKYYLTSSAVDSLMCIYQTKRDILEFYFKKKPSQLDPFIKNWYLETWPEGIKINEFEINWRNLEQFEMSYEGIKNEAKDNIKLAQWRKELPQEQVQKLNEIQNILKDYQSKNLEILTKNETSLILISDIYQEMINGMN